MSMRSRRESRIAQYMKETEHIQRLSEIELYTPVKTHIFQGLLGYSATQIAINERGERDKPDIKVYTQPRRGAAEGEAWVVGEGKLNDTEIRSADSRERVWEEQVKLKYLKPDTVYVLLFAPRTFIVLSVRGEPLVEIRLEGSLPLTEAALHIIDYDGSPVTLPLTDENFMRALSPISHASCDERPQYELFRAGKLRGGHIALTYETLPLLHETFDFAVRGLKALCESAFDRLEQIYQTEAEPRLTQMRQELDDLQTQAHPHFAEIRTRLRAAIRRHRRRYSAVLGLFEDDYQQFRHDQMYSSPETDAERREEIFGIFS